VGSALGNAPPPRSLLAQWNGRRESAPGRLAPRPCDQGFNGHHSADQSQVGSQIDWYNAQFYCGWGSLATTNDYNSVVHTGGPFTGSRVVAGTVTNPANCSGYVQPTTLASTISSLASQHADFGGVAGWEYFNSIAVGGTGPQSWYQNVKNAMG